MRYLIDEDIMRLEPAVEPETVAIRFDVEPVDPSPRTPIDAIPTVEPPPTAPVSDRGEETPGAGPSFIPAPPGVEPIDHAGTGAEMAFGPPPLTVRVPPACPARVIARGVEGDCTVRYDILASGRTATLAIVSCDSRGFERAMTEAVSRWQYAPDPDRSDVAAVRRGVTATLEFRLTE